MARLNVNPTRMELTRLKRQLSTATRGHKLLKDKQDELMRQFILMVRRNNELRQSVEATLVAAMRSHVLASATLPQQYLEEAMAIPATEVKLDVVEHNIMSVKVPRFNFDYEEAVADKPVTYGFLNTTEELDDSYRKFTKTLPQLLELAQLEKTCQLLAAEIEKTRRRVNALEYMTIPQLEETIAFIRMKLEETERSDITRIMKVKEFTKEK